MAKPLPEIGLDGSETVKEVVAIGLQKGLPQELQKDIPLLTEKITRSFHVSDHLDDDFAELPNVERAEIVREISVAIMVHTDDYDSRH